MFALMMVNGLVSFLISAVFICYSVVVWRSFTFDKRTLFYKVHFPPFSLSSLSHLSSFVHFVHFVLLSLLSFVLPLLFSSPSTLIRCIPSFSHSNNYFQTYVSAVATSLFILFFCIELLVSNTTSFNTTTQYLIKHAIYETLFVGELVAIPRYISFFFKKKKKLII